MIKYNVISVCIAYGDYFLPAHGAGYGLGNIAHGSEGLAKHALCATALGAHCHSGGTAHYYAHAHTDVKVCFVHHVFTSITMYSYYVHDLRCYIYVKCGIMI